MPCDPNRLQGSASYNEVDGMTALYVPGSGHAEVPAIAIDTISFTFSCWVKILGARRHIVFSDWTSPYQFIFEISSSYTVGLTFRHTSQSDLLGASYG